MTQNTATDRALRNPIILSRIFEIISMNNWGFWHQKDCNAQAVYADCLDFGKYDHGWCICYGGNCNISRAPAVLSRCGRVNRIWFYEAMPLLWRKPYAKPNLYDLFVNSNHTTLDRQQFYANLIENAVLRLDDKSENADMEPHFLRNLEFPRLKRLTIHMQGGMLSEGRFPRVEVITLQREDDLYPRPRITPKILASILRQIPALFPRLKKIVLIDVSDDITIEELFRLYPQMAFEIIYDWV